MTPVGGDRGLRALLVASRGGHLNELALLADRFVGVDERVWVTFPGDQAASLLPGEDVRFVDDVPPRRLGATLRTLPAAWRLLGDVRPDVVISSGAAVALPFFTAAAGRNIRSVYVESAARQDTPSLTGRLAGRLPRVRLLGQGSSMPEPWRFVGSVFDRFAPCAPSGPPGRCRRVLVTLGTMDFPFHRLVRTLNRVLPPDVEVVWQVGRSAGDTSALPGTIHASVPHRQLLELLDWCDVVVAHAGVGTVLTALERGRVPLLVPRRRAFDEHVDDHQVGTAADLQARGLALACEAGSLTWPVVESLAGRACGARPDVPPIDLHLERRGRP